MAMPGLQNNRKFRRLARALDVGPMRGFGRVIATGALELLWGYCYEALDDVLGTPDDLEATASWAGDPGVLFAALRDAGSAEGGIGFIEECPDKPGIWRVHDLWDHAPEYVSRQLKRKLFREENGETISQLRAEAGRKGGLARAASLKANGKQTGDTCLANVATTASPRLASPRQTEASSEPVEPAHEPAPPPDASPVVARLPCAGKGTPEHAVTEAHLADLADAYPGLDLAAETRKARAWLVANPTRRKTARGAPAFLVNWFNRAQNSNSRSANGPNGTQRTESAANREMRLAWEAAERELNTPQPRAPDDSDGCGVRCSPPLEAAEDGLATLGASLPATLRALVVHRGSTGQLQDPAHVEPSTGHGGA